MNVTKYKTMIAASMLLWWLLATTVFAQMPDEKLPSKQPLTREIKSGETHNYKINLKAGEFLRVLVEQRGADVVVRLFAPDGRLLAERDRPNGKAGEESLSIEANMAGEYRLEIDVLEAGAAGKYTARSELPRTVTAADKRRIAAETAFQEAMKLRETHTPESWRKALMRYEEALLTWQSLVDDYAEALTLSIMAYTEATLGDSEQAARRFVLALRKAEAVKSDSLVEEIKTGLAKSYFDAGYKEFQTGTLKSRQTAVSQLKTAIELYQGVGDKAGEAFAQLILGNIARDLGEKTEALKYYEKALPLFRVVGEKSGEAFTLNNIGIVYGDSGDNQKALKFFNESLSLFRAVVDKNGEANALSNIGAIYAELGDKQQALKFYIESLPLRRVVGDKRGEATTLHNIGSVYLDLDDKQQALKFYNEALTLFRAVGYKSGEARTLININLIYSNLDNKQQSLKFFTEALSLSRAVGDKNGEAYALHNIAGVYADLGDKQEALKFYTKALSLYQVGGDKRGEATTLHNISTVYLDLGKKQQALKLYNEVLALFRAVGYKEGEANTLKNLMLGWQSQNNRRLAVLYGKQSVNVYQQLRANIQTLDKALQNSFLKSVEDTYRKLSDILIAEGRILEAEQVLNLLKTEEFGAVLRRTGEAEKLLPYSAAEEAALKIIDRLAALGGQRADLLGLKAKGAFPADGDARLTEIDAQIASANAEFRRSLEALAKAAPVEFDLKQAQTLQSDLRELGAGTVALYTLVVCGDDSPLKSAARQKNDVKQCEKVRTGWIILVTPDFRKAYPIDVRELNETVAALRQALSSDRYEPAPAAKKLYNKLFRQTSAKQSRTLEADLNEYFTKIKAEQKTLMWSLDGVLRYIPTAVLHDGNSYLIEKYRSFIFTTASLTRLKDKNKPDWTVFGLGVSEARDGFQALPGVKRELLAIVRDGQLKNTGAIMPGVIRLDKDFTRQAFLEGLREGYPVVHLASHFSYKNKQEDSFLLLGDSRLTLGEMRDFAPIFENVDLLTLSACNTATSDADNGKEVEGLGFVAQSLGAKAVIASLWEVSDTGTDELMNRFYKFRADHPTLSKGEAFRRAQLALHGAEIKNAQKNPDAPRSEVIDLNGKKVELPLYEKDEQKPFAHPHYWSSFVLIGNWK